MDGNDTIGKAMVENMGVAVGILFLSRLEPEICLGVIYPPVAGERSKNSVAGSRG